MNRKLSYLFFGLSALMFAIAFGNLMNPNADRPSEFSVFFSYAVGQLLIPYIFMILGIYFFKKSQHDASKKNRRIFNGVILGLNLLLLVFYCVFIFNSHKDQININSPVSSPNYNNVGKSVVLPDFSFTIPAGWTRTRPDRPKTAVVLVKFGSTMDEVLALIKVDMGRSLVDDYVVVAKELASNWGGEVPDAEGEVDGVKAAFISSEYKGGQLQPVEGMVAIHNGKLFMLMGGVSTDEDISSAINYIVESWQWQ